MSQADVESLLRGLEAFNRGDLDAAWESWAEDGEWYPYLGSLEARVYRGREEITGMWRQMREHLGLRVEARDVTDLGDQLVVDVSATGTGTESGAEVQTSWGQLITMREGLAAKVEAFESRDEALAEARRRSGR